MLTFDQQYRQLLREACFADTTTTELNARTQTRVNVIAGGVSLKLDLSDGVLPCTSLRRTFPRSAAAEVAWFLQGTQNVEFIRKYAPLWDKFTEADGQTIAAAYGYRWRRHFGRDQLAAAIAALQMDPSDRRVNISAWDPATDGLGGSGQKNVPCPTNFTLSLVGGRLHSALFLRSSDLFVGLPYDVMGHAILMSVVAASLGRQALGTMHVTLAHAHLYEAHWDMTVDGLKNLGLPPAPCLPTWNIDSVCANPDAFVHAAQAEASRYEWPIYNPKPHVVE